MMAESGVEILQYRSKYATSRQLFDTCAVLAREWPRLTANFPAGQPRAPRFIVNDRADIAALVGAGGVHVGQTDLGVGAGARHGWPASLGRRLDAQSRAGCRRRRNLRRLHRLRPDFPDRHEGKARSGGRPGFAGAGAPPHAQAAGGHRRHYSRTRRSRVSRRRRFAGRHARPDGCRRPSRASPRVSCRSPRTSETAQRGGAASP